MPTRTMKVINPNRDQRSYVVPQFEGPIITGGGDDTYVCGRCETALLLNVEGSKVRDLAIQCAKCGKVNSVLDPNDPQSAGTAKTP